MNDMDSAHVRDVVVSNVSSIAAQIEGAVERLGSFAVAYRLIPFRDGDQWCVLLGGDIQSGIAGFGDSPALAIEAFDRAMYTKATTVNPAVKDSLTTAPAQDVVRDADGYLRPAVAQFARRMEDVLRKNDRKGGWEGLDQVWLHTRMIEEARELEAAIRYGGNTNPAHEHAVLVANEAADVANFAMMIADNAIRGYAQIRAMLATRPSAPADDVVRDAVRTAIVERGPICMTNQEADKLTAVVMEAIRGNAS